MIQDTKTPLHQILLTYLQLIISPGAYENIKTKTQKFEAKIWSFFKHFHWWTCKTLAIVLGIRFLVQDIVTVKTTQLAVYNF